MAGPKKLSTPLTASQKDVLRVFEDCKEAGLPAPSYREIAQTLGYSAVGTVQGHVEALLKKGYLQRLGDKEDRRQARSIILADRGEGHARRVPIYGEIAAGSLRATEQIDLGAIWVSSDMSKGECFALRVSGESMIGAGIFDGDVVVVSRSQRARHGDIVAALVDGETTIKRLVKKDETAYLVPENPTMKPIPLKGKETVIQGKVIALQRRIG